MDYEIMYADIEDIGFLQEHDIHINNDMVEDCVGDYRIIVVKNVNQEIMGWLRFNFFWDSIPFVNMLYILDQYRGYGLGKVLMEYFENEMKLDNYNSVMTSTQESEKAKDFYSHLGYLKVGSFWSLNEGEEIIMRKEI